MYKTQGHKMRLSILHVQYLYLDGGKYIKISLRSLFL